MIHIMWIGSAALVGGLVGLRRSCRHQTADAVGCVIALGVASWQHSRLEPFLEELWGARAVHPLTTIYLFAVLYGMARILISLYEPTGSKPGSAGSERGWIGGVIGATRAAALAWLALTVLPLPHP